MNTEHVHDDLEEAVETFAKVRPRLMAIGYRFLASRTEAEDLVQETWLRWQKTDRAVVKDPQALLATMTTRLAINVCQSARFRREVYTAPSDAARPDADDDPGTMAEARDTVGQALLVVMQNLTPRELAAFVLREAFDYPYGQLSEFLHLSAVNTRQLVSRARKRIDAGSRATVSSAAHQRFRDAFLNAARTGDLTGLEELLAADLAGRTRLKR